MHLAEAISNTEIEQQLARPWSEDQVGQAFKEILAGWKAINKPKRMKGVHSCPVWENPAHDTAAYQVFRLVNQFAACRQASRLAGFLSATPMCCQLQQEVANARQEGMLS